MADVRTIARLADLHEFAELKQYFDELAEEEVQKLARKTFALPEQHDMLEWQLLKARCAGRADVLSLPVKERESQRKESQ